MSQNHSIIDVGRDFWISFRPTPQFMQVLVYGYFVLLFKQDFINVNMNHSSM